MKLHHLKNPTAAVILALLCELGLAAADTRSLIEGKLRPVIERLVPANMFYLDVQVSPGKKARSKVPSFLDFAQEPSESMGLANIKTLTGDIKVTMMISPKINGKSREQLAKIIKSQFSDDGKGVIVKFEDLTIELPIANAETPSGKNQAAAAPQTPFDGVNKTEYDKLMEESRQLKAASEKLSKEKDSTQRQLENAKLEVDRIARESGMSKSMVWFAAIGALALILTFGIFVFRSVFMALSQAISSIAGNLKGSGSGGSAVREIEQQARPSLSEKAESAQDKPAALPSGDGQNLQFLEVKVNQMMLEFSTTITPAMDAVIVEFLGASATDPAGCQEALAVLELIGIENAKRVFHQLPRSTRRQILSSGDRKGLLGKDLKLPLMSAAGDRLKTKIFGEDLDTDLTKPSAELRSLVATMDRKILQDLVETLAEELLPRLLYVVPPAMVNDVMQRLKTSESPRYDLCIAALAAVSSKAMDSKLDAKLCRAVEPRLKKQDSAALVSAGEFYKHLFSEMSDDSAEKLWQAISESNRELHDSLREQIITFSVFWNLAAEYKRQVLDTLALGDIAKLCFTLNQTQVQDILSNFDARTAELLMEEVTSLSSRGADRSVSQHAGRVKKSIVSEIIKLKGDDPLQQLYRGRQSDKSESESFQQSIDAA